MSEEIVTPPSETPTPPIEAPADETPTSLVAEATKPAEEAAPAPAEPVAPLTAEDIVIPEGFTASDELITEFLDVMNNSELSAKDRASSLVALQTKALTQASEASSAAWETLQNEWRDAVRNDPVIGGANFNPTLESIGKLTTEYGTPELIEVFNLTGAGNNPHVLRFLANIAGKLTEGGFTGGQPAGAETSAAQRLFPSMKG